jgi:S-adenosylmethionine:tRNA ribosyltransferase-isomerase
MQLEDFDYTLPEELIAQAPVAVRDQSRMMVVRRDTGDCRMLRFSDFPEYFGRGDVVVVNDSRVFPARLIGRKQTGGLIEILLLRRQPQDGQPPETWEVLLRPAKRVAAGMTVSFAAGGSAQIVRRLSEKQWLLSFTTALPFADFLARYGRAPLPPYIKRDRNRDRVPLDLERYQTVYAREQGSVAAPTAGLHFTPEVLARIAGRGAQVAPLTLHVGYGTFLPIAAPSVEEHLMEEEHFSVGPASAEIITRAERVVAVGTTSTRVLESIADEGGRVRPQGGSTRLFIYPGHRFRRVDALLTNFHLPKSSLFLLVCAFAGRELMQEAYRQAVAHRFRFFSYGDCMLIL